MTRRARPTPLPTTFWGDKTYTSSSIFWGESTSTDLFAAFSLPNRGETQRGYVSYTAAEAMDSCIIDAWINYIHQDSSLQYPAITAMEAQMRGTAGFSDVFRLAQDALQFYSEGGRNRVSVIN